MLFSERELWTIIHGIGLGGLLLLAFAVGFALLASIPPVDERPEGTAVDPWLGARTRRLRVALTIVAALAWATAIVGTFVVYPWYRAEPPPGTSDLAGWPRAYLLSRPDLAAWHEIGMEWKEHLGWFVPMLATAAAWLATRAGTRLATDRAIRRAVSTFLAAAFALALTAGMLGAFVNKIAPVR